MEIHQLILFWIESTHLPSFDRWNLSARPCPSGCRLLQFDQCWVEIHEILDRFGSGRESLQNLSWCISFSNYGQENVLLVLQSSHDDFHWGRPFLMCWRWCSGYDCFEWNGWSAVAWVKMNIHRSAHVHDTRREQRKEASTRSGATAPTERHCADQAPHTKREHDKISILNGSQNNPPDWESS